MGSRLAITEKRPAKGKGLGLGGVLFRFFDWNKMLSKRKKKLFLDNKLLLLPSGGGSKKFGGDERMPKSKSMHFLVNNENIEGSKFAQKQNRVDDKMRDPGPVAKLMGLESMPIVQNKKPIRSSEFASNRYETLEVKELRPQKLQRTGGFMERPQQPVASPSEALQSNRRARRLHHHKLASPVKSPRLLAKRSTSRLMGAATKILEPGLQSRRNHARCALTYTVSSHCDEKVSKEGVFMKKCSTSMDDSVIGASRSFRSVDETMELGVKDDEKTLVKGYTLESRTPSPFSVAKLDAKRSLVVPIGKDRPTSPDVQPKINAESRPRCLYQKKNCIQNEQNRQIWTLHQLAPVRGRLAYGSSNGRGLIASGGSLSSRTHSRPPIKELGRERAKTEGNGLESKNKAPKRRTNVDLLAESGKVVSFASEKRQSASSDLINGKAKGIVNIHSPDRSSVKSEFTNHVKGNGASGFEGNGIVSFTFVSPMKHVSRSLSNENMSDKRRCIGKPKSSPSRPMKLVSAEKIHSIASKREETLRGDSVSAISEQNIEESNSLDADEFATEVALQGRATATIPGGLISALRPSLGIISHSGSTNISDHAISRGEMFKAKAEPEAGVSSAFLVDGDHPSPMSILDVSFSHDSCVSGSPNGSSGQKPDFGSIDTCTNVRSIDLDTDLLDSASSFDIEKLDTEKIPNSLAKNSVLGDAIDLHDSWFSESTLSYSTDAKYNAKLLIDNISLPKSNGNASFIYDTLEAITKALGVTDIRRIQLRRLLFDCTIECLDAQYDCFFKPGSKLSLLTRSNGLAKVVVEEIEGWNGLIGMGMVDVVEKDMRHSNRTWTMFGLEAFEMGLQIANDIVSELVGEIVVGECI